eukprot:Amastigsp_a174371_748.p1 type:complete len:130 gc:universal Amastigsp_a174371_748:549-160(-)
MGHSIRSKVKRKFRALARAKQAVIDVEKTKVMHAKLLATLEAGQSGATAESLAEQTGETMAMDDDDQEHDADDQSQAAMSIDGKSNAYYKKLRESKANRKKHMKRQALVAAGLKRNAPAKIAKRVLKKK